MSGHGYRKFPSGGSSLGPTVPSTQVSTLCPAAMLREGQWCLADYTILRELGSGRASVVYHAVCKRSHCPVALKVYRKSLLSNVTRRQVDREAQIHLKLHHEHLLACHAVFEDPMYICMVLEYAAGGDLMKTLMDRGQLSELQASKVISPLLSALEYMHGQAILHRDIKPENIVFTRQGVLKLADLGTAIDLREERAVSRLGTLDYMAPEVVRCPDKRLAEDHKDRLDLQYSVHADVWSVGILGYELITGVPPFEKEGTTDTMDAILSVPERYPVGMSRVAKSFIQRALSKKPESRPYVKQLMQDPFVLLSSDLSPQDNLAGVIFPDKLPRHQSYSGSSSTLISLCEFLAAGARASTSAQGCAHPSLLARAPSAPVPQRSQGCPTSTRASHGCFTNKSHKANLSPLSTPAGSAYGGGLALSPVEASNVSPSPRAPSPGARQSRMPLPYTSRFAAEACRSATPSPSRLAGTTAAVRHYRASSLCGHGLSTSSDSSSSSACQALFLCPSLALDRTSQPPSNSRGQLIEAMQVSDALPPPSTPPAEDSAMETSFMPECTEEMDVDTSVNLSIEGALEESSHHHQQQQWLSAGSPTSNGLKAKARTLSEAEGLGQVKMRRTSPEDSAHGSHVGTAKLRELSVPLAFSPAKVCTTDAVARPTSAPIRSGPCSWSPFSSPSVSPRLQVAATLY